MSELKKDNKETTENSSSLQAIIRRRCFGKLKKYESLINMSTLLSEAWEDIDTDKSCRQYTGHLIKFFMENAGHWVELNNNSPRYWYDGLLLNEKWFEEICDTKKESAQ